MNRLSLLLLVLLGLLLQPIASTRGFAQDGADDDDDTEIEIGGEDDDDGFDEEEQRKKNAGLAGGGKEKDDTPLAPKVKASLQVQINEAIKKGVVWLKKRQEKDGTWGPVKANKKYDSDERGDFTRDPTGPTSFSIYTLAKCEVKKSDPVIKKGLKWLKERTLTTYDMTGKKETRPGGDPITALTTYESASIVMMLEALHHRSKKLTGKHKSRQYYTDNPLKPPTKSRFTKEDWLWMHNRIVWLTVGRRVGKGGGRGRGGGGGSSTIKGTQNASGPNAGGWRYGQANGDADLSATQFALLALRAASQAGYPIDKVAPDTFKLAANYAKSVQLGSGAFTYQRGQQASAGMDACGIGSLLICQEQMQLMGQPPLPWIGDSIKRGMAHLDTVFDVQRNVGQTGMQEIYYYLYGVERVGDLSGRKEFAGKDWYVRGAQFLIANQNPDGKWVDQTGFPPRDVLGTCFALLFLKRATPPTITFSERE